MNEQISQYSLLNLDPLSETRTNKLNTQGEKLETTKLRVFVSNITSLPLVKAAIYEIRFFFFFSYFDALRTQRKIVILFCIAR